MSEGAVASLPRLAAVQALRATAVEALLHELAAVSTLIARSAQILAEQLQRSGVELLAGWASGELSESFDPGATGPELHPPTAYRQSSVTGARGLVQYWRETLGRWDGTMRAGAVLTLSELAQTVVELSVETARMAAVVGDSGGPASHDVRRSLGRASSSLARLAKRGGR